MTIAQVPFEERFPAERFIGSDYVLLEPFAEGGQGIVWSAWDTRNRRVVAMKLMDLDARQAADMLSFFHETQRLELFQHPNILPIYDCGTDKDYSYLVGPYLPSKSLDILLKSGSLSAAEVLAIATQIASALDYLHARHIVHRDLKPSNILIDSRKRVYITDFGLAKELVGTTRALHTGHGTTNYAPPEQHTLSPVSPGGDIYSLGIMVYQMLAGKLPWDGQASLGIQQLDKPTAELPDPRDENPALPAALTSTLREFTASNVADRPASAGSAVGLIAEALRHNPAAEGLAAHSNGTAPRMVRLQSISDYRMWAAEEADDLLKRAMGSEHSGQNQTTLTDYAFMDSVYSQPDLAGVHVDGITGQSMLQMALVYGNHLDYWWQAVADPRTRWNLCEQAILLQKQPVIQRVIEQMLKDPSQVFDHAQLSSAATDQLIRLAVETTDTALCSNALEVIERSTKTEARWQLVGFGLENDDRLADLAMAGGPQASQAAYLIGLARSETAVRALLGTTERGDLTPPSLNALMKVAATAGNLPASIPAVIRLRVMAGLVRRQLLAQPAMLVRAYLAASAGAALGLGLYVYLTYRVPSYEDAARILNAVGSGLLFGLMIGLGIFTTLLIAGRLRIVPPFPRIALAAAAGTVITSLAVGSFHTLFMGANPEGWLVPMGACLIALGFALGGGLVRSRIARGLISSIATAAGIGLSWQLHLISNLTPVFYYDQGQTWPTLPLILITALAMGSAAHLVDLTVPFERNVSYRSG